MVAEKLKHPKPETQNRGSRELWDKLTQDWSGSLKSIIIITIIKTNRQKIEPNRHIAVKDNQTTCTKTLTLHL